MRPSLWPFHYKGCCPPFLYLSLFASTHAFLKSRMRSLLLFIIWEAVGLTLLTSIGLKLNAFGTAAYAKHWTNWGWTALGLFVTFVAWLQIKVSDVGLAILLAVYFPFRAVWWMIFFGVNVLFLSGSDLLDVMATQYDLGLIIFGNDVIHVWPILVEIAFLAVYYPFVFTAFQKARRYLPGNFLWVVFLTYQLVGGTIILFATYAGVLRLMGTNLATVYYTIFTEPIAMLGVIGTGVLVNGVLLLYLLSDGLGEEDEYSRFMERTTHRVVRDVVRRDSAQFPSRQIDVAPHRTSQLSWRTAKQK